jgi:hypothetical protein
VTAPAWRPSDIEFAVGVSRALASATALPNRGWNVDQMHRLACGLEPDLDREALATSLAMVRRNGRVSLRPKRDIR